MDIDVDVNKAIGINMEIDIGKLRCGYGHKCRYGYRYR